MNRCNTYVNVLKSLMNGNAGFQGLIKYIQFLSSVTSPIFVNGSPLI